MRPRPITHDDVHYWANVTQGHVARCRFTGPGEVEAGVEPCDAVITRDQIDDGLGQVVRVPWTLNEIELAHLARGGTLWLSTWGGLPIHMLEVQPPEDGERS